MEKKIQNIINKHIILKQKLIEELKTRINYKNKNLTLIVDKDNINESYCKAIKKSFNTYLPEIKIDYIMLDKNMDEHDIIMKLVSNIDLISSYNGHLFIQPSITGVKSLSVGSDLDKIECNKDLWNKYNLPITAKVIFDIIEDYVRDIKNPNIVIIGDGLTVGRKLNLCCQQQSNWNTYQIKECFKRKDDSKLGTIILNNADIVISATGNAESLWIQNTAVISPTISYNKRNKYYCHDLDILCVEHCDTHTPLNSIGILTNLELIIRFLNNIDK